MVWVRLEMTRVHASIRLGLEYGKGFTRVRVRLG